MKKILSGKGDEKKRESSPGNHDRLRGATGLANSVAAGDDRGAGGKSKNLRHFEIWKCLILTRVSCVD